MCGTNRLYGHYYQHVGRCVPHFAAKVVRKIEIVPRQKGCRREHKAHITPVRARKSVRLISANTWTLHSNASRYSLRRVFLSSEGGRCSPRTVSYRIVPHSITIFVLLTAEASGTQKDGSPSPIFPLRSLD